MSDHVFNKVVSEYFEKPGAEDFSTPTGKDGEPLTAKGREIAKIKAEEKEWHEYHLERAMYKLQDNFTWVLDNMDDDSSKDQSYYVLVDIIKRVAEYHNETGKKAERLLAVIQDTSLLDE
jgi:hypothetical protein